MTRADREAKDEHPDSSLQGRTLETLRAKKPATAS
jgi:hypothetical protein